MSNLKDYLGGLDTTVWTNAKADHLEADVSTRAAASTALTNITWTDARAAKLDDISATDVSNLDVAVSTRAPASTALSTTDWTTARAGKLDNVDATISSRAPSSTALSTSTWTNARAAKLDLISSAASLSSCLVQHLSTRSMSTSGTNWSISSVDRTKSFITCTGDGGGTGYNYDGWQQNTYSAAKFTSNTNISYVMYCRSGFISSGLSTTSSVNSHPHLENSGSYLYIQCTTIS